MSDDAIDFSWTERAACKGEDTDLFFPGRGEEQVGVLALCGVCPVRAECLAYALEHEDVGVWGGTSAKQRRAIRRRSGIRLRAAPSLDHIVLAGRGGDEIQQEAS